MDPQNIKKILQDLKSGKIDPGSAYKKLKDLPFEDLGFANLDHHRAMRTGMPEVIFAPGKTSAQIVKLATSLKKTGIDVMITRTDKNVFKQVKAKFRSAIFNPDARIVQIPSSKKKVIFDDIIAVISAGTSDIPVAEEAAATLEIMGHNVSRIFDVGVAGIHRLFAHKQTLRKAGVIIVVAGMEGALASVVGGLVDVPVIAVPTSIGYGASFNGLAALLGMLNSCVPGVVVVNIDNGFGAACAASLMIKRKKR